MAACVTWGYGSIGSFGFNHPAVRTRWHEGFRHSDFLTPDFCKKYWIPFLRDGTIVKGSDKPSRLPWTIRAITKIPLRWIFLLLCLGLPGLAVWHFLYGGPLRLIFKRSTVRKTFQFQFGVFNKIHDTDKKVGAATYQRDWILVDAKKGPIINVGTEYESKCKGTESDNRLATDVVSLGSQLTAWSCNPKHKRYYECPPIDCSK
jgi:hypothetical protein